jgi:ketosteroid isomerase-like protein
MATKLTTLRGIPPDDARRFAERWLPAWTGGDADRLIAFYAPDAFYRHPHVTDGLTGTAAIKQYFPRLLARNADWVWTRQQLFRSRTAS